MTEPMPALNIEADDESMTLDFRQAGEVIRLSITEWQRLKAWAKVGPAELEAHVRAAANTPDFQRGMEAATRAAIQPLMDDLVKTLEATLATDEQALATVGQGLRELEQRLERLEAEAFRGRKP